MSASQQFCVRWNSHLGSFGAAFPQLLADQRFVDVTLACEGHQVHCHRLVLAACSTYFETLLGENPCKHPIVILPYGIKLWEIQALIDFMYKGEVNVSQAGLPELIKCAEILKIRGLSGADANINLNQQNQRIICEQSMSKIFTSGMQAAATQIISPNSGSKSSDPTGLNNQSVTKPNTTSNDNRMYDLSSIITLSSPGTVHVTPVNLSDAITTDASPIIDTDEEDDNIMDSLRVSEESFGSNYGDIDDNDISSKSENGQQVHHSHDGHDFHNLNQHQQLNEDQQNLINAASNNPITIMPSSIKSTLIAHKSTTITTATAMPIMSTSVGLSNQQRLQQEPNNSLLLNTNIMDNENKKSSTALSISSLSITPPSPPTILLTTTLTPINNTRGSIRVKSNENLFENYNNQQSATINKISQKSQSTTTTTTTMTSTTTSINQTNKKCPVQFQRKTSERIAARKNRQQKLLLQQQQQQQQNKQKQQAVSKLQAASKKLQNTKHQQQHKAKSVTQLKEDFKEYDEISCQLLAPSLKFNRNTMAIYVKTTSSNNPYRHHNHQNNGKIPLNIDGKLSAEKNLSQLPIQLPIPDTAIDSQYENIICSPHFTEISYSDDDIDDVGNSNKNNDTYSYNHGDDNITFDKASSFDQTIQNNQIDQPDDVIVDEMIYCEDIINEDDNEEDEDDKKSNITNLPLLIPFKKNKEHQNENNELNIINCFHQQHQCHNHQQYQLYYDGNQQQKNQLKKQHKLDQLLNKSDLLLKSPPQPPRSFTLRNPRCNQPRTYNTDALWAALMGVKSGESIYRASQIHKVPRKTLRNWMKRCDIKSAYPMPDQLKQAAEKKRRNKFNQMKSD